MSELLKNQKFGVEVEFTGITRETAAKAVAEVLNVTTVSGPASRPYYERTIKDSKNRIWKVMRDSSISPEYSQNSCNSDEYKVEFVTPPLNYDDIELVQAIIRKFRELESFLLLQAFSKVKFLSSPLLLPLKITTISQFVMNFVRKYRNSL